ncbi:unnamed protein product [Absidia cylindrospora]
MLGVTSPLSLASSSESDHQLELDLVTVLQQQKAYEPTEKSFLRKKVLETLINSQSSLLLKLVLAKVFRLMMRSK